MTPEIIIKYCNPGRDLSSWVSKQIQLLKYLYSSLDDSTMYRVRKSVIEYF